MTTPAADDGEGGRAAEPPPSSSSSPLVSAPTGDRIELGTSSSRQQRSRSASPPCFGARTRRQTAAAATNGETVVNDEPTAEHHPRKSGRSPPARNAIATDAPISSASSSPTSSPRSSLRDRLRLGLTTSPPRDGSDSPPYLRSHGGGSDGVSRSPEAEKGGAVGSYLRRISKLLTTRSAAAAAAADEVPSPLTSTPPSFPLIGDGMRRKGGSAIATEDEIRAFVIANGSRVILLV
uniref:Uncharacterized protein n=1 Tax=Oryza punctata TaxID=4537 RepID=A0A0E0M802_ORYPU